MKVWLENSLCSHISLYCPCSSTHQLLGVKFSVQWKDPYYLVCAYATSGFKSRDGEENGSRIYQLVLHKTSLLPSNIPARNIVPLKYNKDAAALDDSNGDEGDDSGNLGKGKKRASDTPDTGNADRAKRVRVGVTDGDVEMVDSDVFI